MREVVLDTETTGLSPENGDRVVEIGCLELSNHMATGRTYHCYVNPEITMPSAAQDVHGLSDEFLADKPLFAAIVDNFLAFVGDAPLIIHNAAFDMGFVNAELKRLGQSIRYRWRAKNFRVHRQVWMRFAGVSILITQPARCTALFLMRNCSQRFISNFAAVGSRALFWRQARR